MTQTWSAFTRHNNPITWVLALWVLMASLPIIFPKIAEYESIFAPVTTSFEITRTERADGGILVWLKFEKLRQCEFIDLRWYDWLGRELKVTFSPGEVNDESFTRPVGSADVGPWFISSTADLNFTKAYALHKCHPFWNTQTLVYP